MQTRILLFILFCCIYSNTCVADTDNRHTLYLVRHAEKQTDDSRDPELTAAGKTRAEKLANWLLDKNITAVWSSNYKRTRDTAAPLLAKSGLGLTVYDPGNQAEFANILLSQQHNALVVGHSNTIPELARILCGCAVDDMGESEYDRLITMTVIDQRVHVETSQQAN